MMLKRTTGCKGFSLVELMIVVAIIGILAAVATPAYMNHVRRTRQTEGVQKLMDAKVAQEKHYALADQYAGVITSGTFQGLISFDTADTEFYQFSILSGDASTFRVQALGDLDGNATYTDCWQITEDWAAPQPCGSSEDLNFSLIDLVL